MNEFLNKIYLDNTVRQWLVALGIILFGMLAVLIIRKVLVRRLLKWSSRTTSTIDDFLVKLVNTTGVPLFYFIAIYSGISTLSLHLKTRRIIDVAILFIATFFVVRALTSFISYIIEGYVNRQPDKEVKRIQSRGIILIVNLFIWLLAIIFLIDNLGYDITTVITGLGIGGIAIALAAQTVLGDLFSYFVIFFDKPFEIGDFIVVGDKKGTVEHVGIKTTRIRSLTGEQLVCSNTDLTGSRLHNFKNMSERRIAFTINLVYQTKAEQLKSIPAMVRQIIEQQPDTRFDRGHLSSLAESSINFEFVYFITNPDYNLFMDRQQQIYLDMIESFERSGIQFAYPTRTLYMDMLNNEMRPSSALQPAQ